MFLFANAGIAALAPIDQISEEHFDKVLTSTRKGLLFTVQKHFRSMGKGGSIPVERLGRLNQRHTRYGVYAATKAAYARLHVHGRLS